MIYQPWAVILVPFPFSGLPLAKKRPALILNTREYAANNNHYIIAMITSADNSTWLDDVPIIQHQQAGLVKPCAVRFKIFSVDAPLVIRQVGTLQAEDTANIKRALPRIIDV